MFNITQRIKINKINFSFVFYLFLFIFSPPVVPRINILILLSFYSAFMIFKKYRNQVYKILKTSNILTFIKGFTVFLLYLFFITVLNFLFGNGISFLDYVYIWYRFLLIVPVSIICILYIMLRCDELEYKFEDLLLSIIYAGLIQAAITVVALLIPTVKSFLVKIMYMTTKNKVLTIPYHIKRRFFGFANDMLDSFGYGTGIIACLSLFFAFYKKHPLYMLLFPLLAIVPVVNARTGIFIMAVGFILCIPCFLNLNKKDKIKFSKFFLLIIGLTFAFIAIFALKKPDAWQSTLKDVGSIFKFIFTGEKKAIGYDTASGLFSEKFWKLPSLPYIILGTGHTIFATKGFAGSDVGYINDLWLCGIIGIIILYGIFTMLFVKAFVSSKPIVNKSIVVFLALSLIVFQVKGRAIMANSGILCTILLCFNMIYNVNKESLKSNSVIKIHNIEENDVISVVIPVYKVEKYIYKCIDSVTNQAYKNLEIILVDDGSPDSCPQICDEYAKKDNRIKVIHKENGGLSDARNAGIKVATGKYIAFVDSDDYVTGNYISTLLYTIKKYDADISACNYIKVYEKTGIEEIEPKCTDDLVMTSVEALKDLFTLPNNADVVVWNKLYKTSLFKDNKIEYPKGKLHEDNFTTYKLYYHANKIAFTNVHCYYYLQRNDSIMGNKFNKKRLDILKALDETEEFVNSHNIDLIPEVEFNELLRFLTILNSMVDTRSIDKEVFEDIRAKIINKKEMYISNKYIGSKQKIALKALEYGRGCYILVRRVFNAVNKL